jgi:hypothetical protein
MIPIVGFLVGVYTLARCVAGATENPDGRIHGIGRIVYILAFLATLFLLFALSTFCTLDVERIGAALSFISVATPSHVPATPVAHGIHDAMANVPTDPWHIIEILVQIGLAIFTALMWWSTRSVAVGTANLSRETNNVARKTADLARETVAASVLADRHHQEAMMPAVVLARGIVLVYPQKMEFGGTLQNVGPGIALNVRVWVDKLGEPKHVGAIAPSGTIDVLFSVPIGDAVITVQPNRDGLRRRAGRSRRAEQSVDEEPWREVRPVVVELLFENLFKKDGRTEHHGETGGKVGGKWTPIVYPPAIVSRVRPNDEASDRVVVDIKP